MAGHGLGRLVSSGGLGSGLPAELLAGGYLEVLYPPGRHVERGVASGVQLDREFEDGALPVSREPGLGVELDRSALRVLHKRYLTCGLTRRDDEAEMQKVKPGWKFQATRW